MLNIIQKNGNERLCEICNRPIVVIYAAPDCGAFISCGCGLKPILPDDSLFFRYSGLALAFVTITLLLVMLA